MANPKIGTSFGRADLPLQEVVGDHLGMVKYAGALARFIKSCETPMTIGLQGEWGSGKTSLMNMIRDKLPALDETKSIHIFEFQTWQYGALNQDEMLGVLLMRAILQAFVARCHDNDKIKWLSSKIVTLIRSFAKSSVAGIADMAGLNGEMLARDFSEAADPGADLQAIRREFEAIVLEMTGGAKGEDGRAVIFIDDLDRVRPERAVAMLEVVKNFMDVRRCVFVIACDYEVVQRGVEARLGLTDPKKAEAFFHKVIQVPFSMPSASYDVRSMLMDYLVARNAPNVPVLAERIAQMVQIATGTNPRAFKRFLNRVDLHSCIELGNVWGESQSAIGLIGLVALQIQWPRLAAYLVHHRQIAAFRTEFEVFCDLVEDRVAGSELEQLLLDVYGEADKDGGKRKVWDMNPSIVVLRRFMVEFQRALECDGRPGLSEAELAPVFRHARDIGLTLVDTRETKEPPTPVEDDSVFFYERWEDADDWRRALAAFAKSLLEGNRGFSAFGIHRARTNNSFSLKTKRDKKTVIAFYERAILYVYLGTGASEYFDMQEMDSIASEFQAGCGSLEVEYKRNREMSCAFDLREMENAPFARFFALLLETIRKADEAISKRDILQPNA